MQCELLMDFRRTTEDGYVLDAIDYAWGKKYAEQRSIHPADWPTSLGQGFYAYVCLFVMWAQQWKQHGRVEVFKSTTWPASSVRTSERKNGICWRIHIIGTNDQGRRPMHFAKKRDGQVCLVEPVLPPWRITVSLDEDEATQEGLHQIAGWLIDRYGDSAARFAFTIILPKQLQSLTPEVLRARLKKIERKIKEEFGVKQVKLIVIFKGSTKIVGTVGPEDYARLLAGAGPSRQVMLGDGVVLSLEPPALPPEVSGESSVALHLGDGVPPSDEEIHEFLAFHYRPYEPRTFARRVRESIALLGQMVLRPEHGFAAAIARFRLIEPPLIAATDDDPIVEELVARARRRGLLHAFVLWPAMSALVVVLILLAATRQFDLAGHY